ncbi:inositol monophosphatase family protein [Solemya elarraichensis gill symbiont]|uniref:Inositol-1-monophosphatase n=1 Tax=Solemya elarraichensis gill symbiont TaxID=1918949 RepID=A0A1T2L7Z3_9GAMM|nr:inositol monophosphatase family protein [Solemya elarraichensis gill symbiont]OOZ41066.1 inositol monophosphatase [Solemya elarraichensis gill symbiont]
MNPMTTIAVRAARAAGRVISRYSERLDAIKIETKKRNDFVSEVDRAAEREIISAIRAAFPDHAILAEESGVHKGNDYQWIIDPLDGTTNYLHGFPQYAVSIALRFRGELTNAVIYDPSRDELFHASRGEGAYLDDRRIRVTQKKGLEGALLGTGIPFRDLTHADAYFGMMRDLIVDTAGVRRPGSAALDFAYVAAGRLDGFWELGLAPWDFAAGALLVKEAGGMVTDIAGGERYLESGNVLAGGPYLHHFLVDRVKPHLNDNLTF